MDSRLRCRLGRATEGVIRSHLPAEIAAFRLPMVAASGLFGRTAAEILQEQWRAIVLIELEAPQRISPLDLAAAFSRALGRKVRVEAVRASAGAEFHVARHAHPLPRIR